MIDRSFPAHGVIPAKAGTSVSERAAGAENRVSRFRGNDPVGNCTARVEENT
jgi:hypothetical protein